MRVAPPRIGCRSGHVSVLRRVMTSYGALDGAEAEVTGELECVALPSTWT